MSTQVTQTMAVAVPQCGPDRPKRSLDYRAPRNAKLTAKPSQRNDKSVAGLKLKYSGKPEDDRDTSIPPTPILARKQSPNTSKPHVTVYHSAGDQEAALHTSAGNIKQPPNGSSAIKRRRDTGSNNEDTEVDAESEPGNPKRKKQRTSMTRQESSRPRFACPYYKKNPEKYKTWRTCPGPGWQTIHRMKEHLYRRHQRQRHACPRCFQTFQNKTALDNHARADPPCPTGSSKPLSEEFDEGIAALLQSRRGQSSLSESERWFDIFKILFRETELPDSPYYDDPQISESKNVERVTHEDSLVTYVSALREDWNNLRSGISTALRGDIGVGVTAARHHGLEHRLLGIVEAFLSNNLSSVGNSNLTLPFIFNPELDHLPQNIGEHSTFNIDDTDLLNIGTQEFGIAEGTGWDQLWMGNFTDTMHQNQGEVEPFSLTDLETQ